MLCDLRNSTAIGRAAGFGELLFCIIVLCMDARRLVWSRKFLNYFIVTLPYF